MFYCYFCNRFKFSKFLNPNACLKRFYFFVRELSQGFKVWKIVHYCLPYFTYWWPDFALVDIVLRAYGWMCSASCLGWLWECVCALYTCVWVEVHSTGFGNVIVLRVAANIHTDTDTQLRWRMLSNRLLSFSCCFLTTLLLISWIMKDTWFFCLFGAFYCYHFTSSFTFSRIFLRL